MPLLLLRVLLVGAGLAVARGYPPAGGGDAGAYNSSMCQKSFACGGHDIHYPFYLSNESKVVDGVAYSYCGYPGMAVRCDDATATLQLAGGTNYTVLGIDYADHTISLADADVMKGVDGGCPRPRHNVTIPREAWLNFTPTGNTTISFFLDCNFTTNGTVVPPLSPELVPINCTGLEPRGRGPSFLAPPLGAPDDGGWARACAEVYVAPVLTGEWLATPDYRGRLGSGGYGDVLRRGFRLSWDPSAGPCFKCELSKGRCSYDQPGAFLGCLCSDGRVRNPACGSERRGKKIMLIGITSAAATFLFAYLYVLIWHRKGKRLWLILCKKTSSNTEKNYEAMIVSYGSLAPKRYMYSEVMKITSSRNNQLGKGGYGVVFKGTLHDGRLVAVKFLHDCKGNGDEFVNEVMSIGRTSHVNVVSLYGFCLEGSKRALIYEYMCNGSLDTYIYSESPKEILGWERLYAIAIGIARGLEYLHHGCNTRIVHFDIKPQNILLDQDFCPKIADFGLAKLCRTKESKLSMIGARGTIGFIAPEVHSRNFGVVSTKSDVYSYGMMLLEMVGGRKNVKSVAEKSSEKYFPDWIYDHFAQDDGLEACEVTSDIEVIARKMTLIGLWCIQVLPVYRPTITKVLKMFERSLDDMAMPPKQNFSGLLENSVHNMNVQSASSTRSDEIRLVNSGNTQQFPPL